MALEIPIEVARHLAHLLERTRRRYRKRLAQCQEHFSKTAVHELRVETRRALALLDLVMALDLPGSPKKPRRALKKRLDAFDELRDAQVELGLIAPWLKKFPEAAEFELFLQSHEDELVAELKCEIRKLKSRRVERALKSLKEEVDEARGDTTQPVTAVLEKPVQDAFERVAALRKKIRRRDTETIHRTRVAFKGYRYLCELLQPLLPGMTTARLRLMQEWQTRMGDIQDAEVLLAQIERAVKRGDVRLASVKHLHAALAKRLVSLVNQFVSTADDLEFFRPKPAASQKIAPP
jgi:CHAD domain-containing protein